MTETSDFQLQFLPSPEGGGRQLILPARELGYGRLIGLMLLICGLLLVSTVIIALILFLTGYFNIDPKSALRAFFGPSFITLICGVVFIAISIWPAFVGHGELTLQDGELIYFDRPAFLFTTQICDISEILEVKICRSWFSMMLPSLFPACITVEHDKSYKIKIGKSYPVEFLEQLKTVLLNELQNQKQPEFGSKFIITESSDHIPTESQQTDELLQKLGLPLLPSGSSILVEFSNDVLSFIFKNQGLFNSKRDIFGFSIKWLMVVATMTIIMLVFQNTNPILMAVLMIGWFIGVQILIYAFVISMRTTIIDIIGNPPQTLLVSRKGIFGIKQHQWPVSEIKKICWLDTGGFVDDQAVKELCIYPSGEEKVRLLAERSNHELVWLTKCLQTKLGLTDKTDDQSPPPANT